MGESEVDWKAVLFGRGGKDNSLRTQSEGRAVKKWDSSEQSMFISLFLRFSDGINPTPSLVLGCWSSYKAQIIAGLRCEASSALAILNLSPPRAAMLPKFASHVFHHTQNAAQAAAQNLTLRTVLGFQNQSAASESSGSLG